MAGVDEESPKEMLAGTLLEADVPAGSRIELALRHEHYAPLT